MFGNIVGLKSTIGSVSSSGLVPACQSIDTITVMAGTVDEALAVQRVIVGYDAADPYSRAAPYAYLRRGAWPAGARIAAVDAAALCDEPVARACARVADFLHAERVDIAPLLHIARLLYDGPWVAERTAEFDEFLAAHRNEINPVVREILEQGRHYTAIDVFNAQHRRRELAHAIHPNWETIEFMLVPTTGTAYRVDEVLADPIRLNTNLGYYTNFTNLLDLAAIAIPSAFTRKGFPVGTTLIGPAWHDALLASFAAALHRRANLPLGAPGVRLPLP
jgi:allophanate hydrolase